MTRTASGPPAGKGRARGPGRAKPTEHWYKMDLHIHTPASADYEQADVTYMDILRQAELKGMDIIALTDHNTVAGCVALRREIEELTLLERLGRIHDNEQKRLEEYRRLGDRVLVLPGFEFTAMFGFHILAVFSPRVSLRELEHVLLKLTVPSDRLDQGSTEIGASIDVLTAYRIIDEAGGLVIAAHANSTNGVAMQNLPFGGQTRIAWTQDPHLHALEVTDLDSRRRFRTAAFFNGSKPEYPRRMHCIQGSDCHRLIHDPNDRGRPVLAERATEVSLPELSFEALKALFLGNDFARTRPYRPAKEPFDHVQAAREQGASIVQSFHESMTTRGGRLNAVLADVVAFANGKGGTIYVGASATSRQEPAGVEDADAAIAEIKAEIAASVTPPLDVEVDALESRMRRIVRVSVPEGPDKPYVLEQSKIYVRQESETNLAVRDEIVQLVRASLMRQTPEPAAPVSATSPTPAEPAPSPVSMALVPTGLLPPPKTGVELVEVVERRGTRHYTMRDLRNGSLVQNVTRSSARKLWSYAITEHENAPVDAAQVIWKGNLGIWKQGKRQGRQRYDLVQRDIEGKLHVYYGVSDEGIDSDWRELVGEGEPAEAESHDVA